MCSFYNRNKTMVIQMYVRSSCFVHIIYCLLRSSRTSATNFLRLLLKMEKNKIWLIGEIKSTFPNDLVTSGDVFRMYFYFRLELLKSKGESVISVAKELIVHYRKRGVPTMAQEYIVQKLHKLIANYDSYKKNMHRETPTQRLIEKKFIDLLDERFYIFPKNYTYKNNEPNTESHEVTDQSNKKNKLESAKESEIVEAPQIVENSNTEHKTSNIDAEGDDVDAEGDDLSSEDVNDEPNDPDFHDTLPKYLQSKFAASGTKSSTVISKIVNSPDVSSALDRTQISSPKFTILCAAIAGAVGENLNESTLSKSTCYRRRKDHRDRIVSIIKDDYFASDEVNLVLHWDGKLLLDTTNSDVALRSKKVERVAVVVSGIKGEKILTVAKQEDGTGVSTAETVYENVIDWSVLDAIVAICTDTTASNTGAELGSVALFQRLADRPILYFACRHHVDEVMIGGVFNGLFGLGSGPTPEIFENFKRDWHLIDKSIFQV